MISDLDQFVIRTPQSMNEMLIGKMNDALNPNPYIEIRQDAPNIIRHGIPTLPNQFPPQAPYLISGVMDGPIQAPQMFGGPGSVPPAQYRVASAGPPPLSEIPKKQFFERVKRVKWLFDQKPDIRNAIIIVWNDERPDLGHMKTDQLLTPIAFDYLKRNDEYTSRNSASEMPVEEYLRILRMNGCPIPKRRDKKAKYEEAMRRQRGVPDLDESCDPDDYDDYGVPGDIDIDEDEGDDDDDDDEDEAPIKIRSPQLDTPSKPKRAKKGKGKGRAMRGSMYKD
jgi:hypothetical protein